MLTVPISIQPSYSVRFIAALFMIAKSGMNLSTQGEERFNKIGPFKGILMHHLKGARFINLDYFPKGIKKWKTQNNASSKVRFMERLGYVMWFRVGVHVCNKARSLRKDTQTGSWLSHGSRVDEGRESNENICLICITYIFNMNVIICVHVIKKLSKTFVKSSVVMVYIHLWMSESKQNVEKNCLLFLRLITQLPGN